LNARRQDRGKNECAEKGHGPEVQKRPNSPRFEAHRPMFGKRRIGITRRGQLPEGGAVLKRKDEFQRNEERPGSTTLGLNRQKQPAKCNAVQENEKGKELGGGGGGGERREMAVRHQKEKIRGNIHRDCGGRGLWSVNPVREKRRGGSEREKKNNGCGRKSHAPATGRLIGSRKGGEGGGSPRRKGVAKTGKGRGLLNQAIRRGGGKRGKFHANGVGKCGG